MVDLNATFAIAPPSVRRHRKTVERQQKRMQRETDMRDAWKEDNAERNMNGIPYITLKDFSRRYTS